MLQSPETPLHPRTWNTTCGEPRGTPHESYIQVTDGFDGSTSLLLPSSTSDSTIDANPYANPTNHLKHKTLCGKTSNHSSTQQCRSRQRTAEGSRGSCFKRQVLRVWASSCAKWCFSAHRNRQMSGQRPHPDTARLELHSSKFGPATRPGKPEGAPV